VPECGNELLGRPPPDFRRRGKVVCVDVNDSGVRVTQFFAVCVGLGVNLLDEGETLSPPSARPMISSSHVVPAVLT
jgi:hypothetical protein